MLSFPVFSWQGDHDAKSEILRVKCIFGTSRKILLRWGTFVNFDSFTELYQGSLKSGCQRKPGKMLKMSTEGGRQNKFILTS